MQQVTSIQELRAVIGENGEMVISRDNDKIVVMDMEEYKKKKVKKDIEKHLLRAEENIINGRYRDAREVFGEWKEKYGI